MNLLCIDDDIDFQKIVSNAFLGYKITSCNTLNELNEIMRTGHLNFDAILIDLNFYSLNGIDIFFNIKSLLKDNQIPCIIITSNDQLINKITAYTIGIDDYIQKPVNVDELRVRINSKIQLYSKLNRLSNEYVFSNIKINENYLTVEILDAANNYNKVELTPIEYKILKCFIQTPNKVYTRDELIERIWGINTYICDRTIDSHISHLRTKINTSQVKIKTIQGVGYKLTA